MFFFVGLAHVYGAVLAQKAGLGEEAVEAELRQAVQESVSPNYASKVANTYLGLKDTREAYRPKLVFELDGILDSFDTANAEDGKC